MRGEKPPEMVSPPEATTARPKVRENKGLPPNWYAHPFAGLPPAARPFALRVKLSLQPNGSLRYRSVSARTR